MGSIPVLSPFCWLYFVFHQRYIKIYSEKYHFTSIKELQAISHKLDYCVQISLSVSQEMGLLFAKLDEAVPMYATLQSNSAELSLYLDRAQRGKFEPSFGRFTHNSKGSYDIYQLKAEELVFEFQMFRKIIQIPSVVPGGFYLKSGFVFAEFRFHHSALDSVSNVVREITEAKNRIRLAYLGESPGLLQTLRAINSRIPLSLITFTFEPDNDYISTQDIDAEPVAEAKLFSSGMESDFDVVYYATKDAGDRRLIDAATGIYESKYRTGFISRLMEEVRNEKIPIASLVGIYHSKLVDNHMFIPSFIADEILNTIFEISDSSTNTSLKLTSFTPIEGALKSKFDGEQ